MAEQQFVTSQVNGNVLMCKLSGSGWKNTLWMHNSLLLCPWERQQFAASSKIKIAIPLCASLAGWGFAIRAAAIPTHCPSVKELGEQQVHTVAFLCAINPQSCFGIPVYALLREGMEPEADPAPVGWRWTCLTSEPSAPFA